MTQMNLAPDMGSALSFRSPKLRNKGSLFKLPACGTLLQQPEVA